MFFDSKKSGVSLRGNSKKEDRSTHLERLERERKERDLTRLRLKSASILQATWRSHRTRKYAKNAARLEWDARMVRAIGPCSNSPLQADSETLWSLRVFVFFYAPKIDARRLERFAAFLLAKIESFRLEASPQGQLYLTKLLIHLQAALPIATKPDVLLLLDLLTSETWLSQRATGVKTYSIFVKMVQRGLFANLRGALQAPAVYEVEHRGKVADIAARMMAIPAAFAQFVSQLLTLSHFPLAVPRATLNALLASLASVPADATRVSIPKDDNGLILLDNILLLCTPVIDSAPASLGCFVSLMYNVVSEMLPPVPLAPMTLSASSQDGEEDEERQPQQLVALPLPLRERMAGLISGGALRSVFLASSTAAVARVTASPLTPTNNNANANGNALTSSGGPVSSIQLLLPPLFFSATRLVAVLRAWAPFEAALASVSKISLEAAQLAPMWTLLQRSFELKELIILDQSISPEVLAVFELFFTSYSTALLNIDDEDFIKHVPVHTSNAAAMAAVLRSVVVRSMSVATFSYAWQSLLDSIFAVLRELHDRSMRVKPFMDANILHLKGNELNGALQLLESHDPQAVKVLTRAFFLFPLEQRVAYFQRLLHEDRLVHQDDPRGLEVTIRRKSLFEDSMKNLQNINLRKVLRIVFVSLDGSTEVGHGGGVTKEFLHLFATTAFNPQFGLFLANEQHKLYPNPCSGVISPNHIEIFTMMGKMLGKMLYDSVPTYIPLTEIAYGILTGRKAHFDDLVHLDQAFYRSLLALKRQQQGIDDLLLNFTITTNEFGTVTTKELKPHGMDVSVTAMNKLEYVTLMADYKLCQQYEVQYAAFKRGFHQLIPEAWVAMFSPSELAALANGNSDHSKLLDLNDLRSNTNYTNGYYDDHITIQFFWQVLAAFTPEQQHKLLQFVTGTDSVPLLGFSQLEPRFCIQLSHVVDRNSEAANDDLPTASTCMNLLKLNPFLDPVVMREKLLYAIENCVGFELS